MSLQPLTPIEIRRLHEIRSAGLYDVRGGGFTLIKFETRLLDNALRDKGWAEIEDTDDPQWKWIRISPAALDERGNLRLQRSSLKIPSAPSGQLFDAWKAWRQANT